MANGNIADTTAKTFAELLSGPVVDVYVGKDKQHWSLHRNLLCHHSEWMQSELLPGETKKKSENKLELPDDDPSGFELFVKWLYQGRIEDVSDIPDNRKWDYAVSCQKLYLLCDRFEMPQLKNLAIDQYRKGLSESRLVPDAEEINEIYRKSPQGSAFRHLMVKIAARQIMDPDSHKDAESYRQCFEGNPDFAVDLVNAIKGGTGGFLFDDPTEGEQCEYHDHSNGPNCHVKGKRRQASRASSSQALDNSIDSADDSTQDDVKHDDSTQDDVKHDDSKHNESKLDDFEHGESKLDDFKHGESKLADFKHGESKLDDFKHSESKHDPKHDDSKSDLPNGYK